MSGFGPLVLKDQPYVTYSQSFDCSKITANFDLDKANELFTILPAIGGTVTISCTYNNVTVSAVDITSQLFTEYNASHWETTGWSNQITGVATTFTTDFAPGDYVLLGYKFLYRIYSIQDDTHLTLSSMCHFSNMNAHCTKISFSYDILPSFFGWTINYMPEGTYTFNVAFTYPPAYEGGHIITDTQSVQVYCEKYCCVYDKLADLADLCGDCIDQNAIKKIVEALFLWGLLESYKGSAGCGDSVSLSALQARLDRYCDYQPCTHC
jgi:hypothetical protein